MISMPRNPFGDVIHWNFALPEHTPEFLTQFYLVGIEELKKREDNEIARDFIVHAEKYLDVGSEKSFTIRDLIDKKSDYPFNAI